MKKVFNLNTNATERVISAHFVCYEDSQDSVYEIYHVDTDYSHNNNWSRKTLDKLMKFNDMPNYEVQAVRIRREHTSYTVAVKRIDSIN